MSNSNVSNISNIIDPEILGMMLARRYRSFRCYYIISENTCIEFPVGDRIVLRETDLYVHRITEYAYERYGTRPDFVIPLYTQGPYDARNEFRTIGYIAALSGVNFVESSECSENIRDVSELSELSPGDIVYFAIPGSLIEIRRGQIVAKNPDDYIVRDTEHDVLRNVPVRDILWKIRVKSL